MTLKPRVTDLQENNECGVFVEWDAPSDGGSDITNYYIAIKTDPENTAAEGNVDMSECEGDVL